jgi:hypothetical protein
MPNNPNAVDNLTPFNSETASAAGKKSSKKGIPHSSTRLRRLLDLTENLKNPVTGEMEGFTVAEQLDLQQIIKARKGDTKAYTVIMDRLEGKPSQPVEAKIEGEITGINVRFIGGDK